MPATDVEDQVEVNEFAEPATDEPGADDLTVEVDMDLGDLDAEFAANETDEDSGGDGDTVPEVTGEHVDDEVVSVHTKTALDDDGPQDRHLKGATADPVKDYLKLIGKWKLLTAEQEVDLAKRIEAGLFAEHKLETEPELDPGYKRDLEWLAEDGRRAKNHLTESNLRLVVSIAKRYASRGGASMSFLDMIQEGNLGLMHAVKLFDYTKGYKFSTYASWWIRQAITRAMADQARTIRIPVHMVELINKLAKIERQMLQDLGRKPTPEELGAELDLTPERVIEIQRYGREPVSIHTPLGEDEGSGELGDIIEDSDAIDAIEKVSLTLLRDVLGDVLDTLEPREAGIIAMRFGLTDGHPKTLDEIGKVYGVTRERIRQVEKEALSKLRHPMRSRPLIGFYRDLDGATEVAEVERRAPEPTRPRGRPKGSGSKPAGSSKKTASATKGRRGGYKRQRTGTRPSPVRRTTKQADNAA